MSNRLSRRIWKLNIETKAKYVLLAMAEHAQEDGTGIFITVSQLADFCHISDRTVQRHQRALKEAGVIVLENDRVRGRGEPNRWRIVLPGNSMPGRERLKNTGPLEPEKRED